MAADEAEAVAEFEDEALQALDQPVFQLALLHRPADAEELQVVAALEHLVRLLGEMLRQGEREVVRLLFLDSALIGAGFDLVEQDIARPAELRGGAQVVEAGGGVGHLVKNESMMAPGNLRDSCRSMSVVPKCSSNLATACGQIWFAIGSEALRQFGNRLSPN